MEVFLSMWCHELHAICNDNRIGCWRLVLANYTRAVYHGCGEKWVSIVSLEQTNGHLWSYSICSKFHAQHTPNARSLLTGILPALVGEFVWSATKTLSNFSFSPTKQPPDDPDTSTIIPGRGGRSTRAGRAWGAGLQWTPANPATTREIQPTASNDRYQPSSQGRCAYSVAALCSRFSDQTSSFLTSSQTGTACTCIGGYETERN